MYNLLEQVKLNIGFNTKYEDESGLIYYNNRYYDSELGRFISQDPIFEEGGVNLYNFVENDPINHWDILGFFIVNDAFEDNYPNANNLLATLSNKTTNIEYDAFEEYEQANRMQVNMGLSYGMGPSINVEYSTETYGTFSPSSPNEINISQNLLNRTNSSNSTEKAQALALLEVTLKHELVHQQLYMNSPDEYDESDGSDENGDGIPDLEEGAQFEIFVWGEVVGLNNISEILEGFSNLGSLNL